MPLREEKSKDTGTLGVRSRWGKGRMGAPSPTNVSEIHLHVELFSQSISWTSVEHFLDFQRAKNLHLAVKDRTKKKERKESGQELWQGKGFWHLEALSQVERSVGTEDGLWSLREHGTWSTEGNGETDPRRWSVLPPGPPQSEMLIHAGRWGPRLRLQRESWGEDWGWPCG